MFPAEATFQLELFRQRIFCSGATLMHNLVFSNRVLSEYLMRVYTRECTQSRAGVVVWFSGDSSRHAAVALSRFFVVSTARFDTGPGVKPGHLCEERLPQFGRHLTRMLLSMSGPGSLHLDSPLSRGTTRLGPLPFWERIQLFGLSWLHRFLHGCPELDSRDHVHTQSHCTEVSLQPDSFADRHGIRDIRL